MLLEVLWGLGREPVHALSSVLELRGSVALLAELYYPVLDHW